jgi:hypothetical protein
MDAFGTLAEVAVAIAGFSSLAIVFRGRSSDWSGQDYVSLAFAMAWSIGSVFLALLPIVLGEFGIDLTTASRVGLFCIVIYMVLVGAILTIARQSVASSGGGVARFSLGISLLFITIVTGALLAGFGLLPGPPNGWLVTGIALLMAHATAELGMLVVSVVRNAG